MKKIPHQKIIDKSRRIGQITKYLLFVTSCFFAADLVYRKIIITPDDIPSGVLSFLEFVGFALYLLFNTFSNICFFRYSIDKRTDLIDNSLGSSFLIKKSEEYFSNENLEYGIYKLSVNDFENTFFTYNISKSMKVPSLIYTSIVIIMLCFSGILGIKDVWAFAIKIPVVASLVIDFIRLWYFETKVQNIYQSFVQFFNSLSGRTILTDTENACALKNIIDYESLHTWWGFHLDSKIFKKVNSPLKNEWTAMKQNLKIPVV